MRYTLATVLALVLAVGVLVTITGPAAAQPEFALQVDEFGPLLELIADLFDISISIEG